MGGLEGKDNLTNARELWRAPGKPTVVSKTIFSLLIFLCNPNSYLYFLFFFFLMSLGEKEPLDIPASGFKLPFSSHMEQNSKLL